MFEEKNVKEMVEIVWKKRKRNGRNGMVQIQQPFYSLTQPNVTASEWVSCSKFLQ